MSVVAHDCQRQVEEEEEDEDEEDDEAEMPSMVLNRQVAKRSVYLV